MTSLTRRLISGLKTVYYTINPSTLNGAIDVIVVQQEDGSLRCTPFHVRFGKLGVLQSLKNKVYITINDVPVDDLYMQLGEAGEAVFIEESDNISNIPPVRHLEPSDSNTFLDPDNAIKLFPEENGQGHSTNIDCSPQIVNNQLDKQQTNDESVKPDNYILEEESKPKITIDVLHSNTIVTSRRRPRRRFPNPLTRQISEEDENDTLNPHSPFKRRSRARKRVSSPMTMKSIPGPISTMNADDILRSSIEVFRKRSASEHDLPLRPFDLELTPFLDAHSRFNSIDSRPTTLNLSGIHNNDDHARINDEDKFEQKSTRTSSNAIPIELNFEPTESKEQSDALNSSVLSQSAPSENLNNTNIRLSQVNNPAEDFYSPTSTYDNTASARSSSPKSDTEYELEKAVEPTPGVGWRWKWGKFPEQRKSVFHYLWPSSTQTATKEDIYLDDITSNRVVDPSRYLPPIDYHQQQLRTTNDDDQESGTGNSIPQSPFREHEASCFLADAQLSLCGGIDKSSSITDELFNSHLITFDAFANNTAIIHDPNLVVRIGGKYYNWNVASALIISASIFNKQLPTETVDRLQEKHMAQAKPRAATGRWWPSFYSKKSDMKNDTTPKATTPITATDIVAMAAKSDVTATTLIRHHSTDNPDTKKGSKTDNDSEQEDSEVRKLTASMEENAQRPRSASTHSAQKPVLKKTMILSSDQLKRLNLKLGMNKVEFSVTTALQGTATVESNIYFFDHMTKFVISDIDGTITRSDVLGQIIPLVGGDWSHAGIAEFYNAIQENGYQFIYLSARAIGQSQITRNFLKTVKQSNRELPTGPLFISPDTLVTALYREVVTKTPEIFKIECLKNILSLYPGTNPFYAGFGNRINDQWAYTAVGIPVTRIYTINPSGEVFRQKLSQALSTNYKNLHEIVDLLFPPMDSFSASETYSVYTYWREEIAHDAFEEEMKAELKEIEQRQKPKKANAKTKATTPTAAAAPPPPATPTTAPVLPRTTPTTTVLGTNGEPLLTVAQATENTVKRK